MEYICKSIGCTNHAQSNKDFCDQCNASFSGSLSASLTSTVIPKPPLKPKESLSAIYPNYFKSVEHLDEVDVYAVHHLFKVNDPSGCIHHASKKLLLSGVRTGGKSVFKDIKEARDTLTRWLEINKEQ